MIERGRALAANTLFVALFPAFFIYHLAAAGGLIPYFFGQWWSHWNFIGAGIFGLILIVRWQEARWWEAAIAALVFIIVAYAGFHYLYGEPWQRTFDLLMESAKLAAGLVCLYGVGRYLWIDVNLSRLIFAVWVIMGVASLALMDPGSYSFVATYRLNATDAATYQWFGQAYALTSLAALAFASGRKTSALVAGVALPILFVLSSRSDLLAFASVLAVWAGVRIFAPAQRRQVIAVGMSGLVFAGTVLVVLTLGQLLPRELPINGGGDALSSVPGEPVGANRSVELLKIEESGSFQQRREMLANGWGDIVSAPITGVYAGQVISGGRFGAYIHNALSAWHNYGLAAFVLYAALSGAALWTSFRAVALREVNSKEWQFAFYTSVFVVVSIIAAKSVYWPLPALAWGLVAARSYISRKAAAVAAPAPTAAPTSIAVD